jgi:hypothetical protein
LRIDAALIAAVTGGRNDSSNAMQDCLIIRKGFVQKDVLGPLWRLSVSVPQFYCTKHSRTFTALHSVALQQACSAPAAVVFIPSLVKVCVIHKVIRASAAGAVTPQLTVFGYVHKVN